MVAHIRLAVGIIGCGRIGQAHLGNLLGIEGVRVKAVCDVSAERAQRSATRCGAAAYEDYQKMLADEELDAVYVLTPTPTHAELGCAVLESGRHLMLEKPIAMDMAEADRLVSVASSTDRVAAVSLQYRYLQGAIRAKELLHGEPIALVRGWWYWTWPLVEWIADRRFGGGQMMDQGIHLIDLARFVAGEIADVQARYTLAARLNEEFHNWDAQVLHGRFKSGALFELGVTYALFREIREEPTLDFIGREVLVRVGLRATEVHRPGETQIFPELTDARAELDRSFVAACQSGERSLVRSTLADARDSLAIVLRANASAAQELSHGTFDSPATDARGRVMR